MGNEELQKVLDVPFCFWNGLPPCPKCNGDHGDPQCSSQRDELLRIVEAGSQCISYAITCRVRNQREWMDGLAERINKYCEIANHAERFQFDGDRICLGGSDG